jgi:hypothetical protein
MSQIVLNAVNRRPFVPAKNKHDFYSFQTIWLISITGPPGRFLLHLKQTFFYKSAFENNTSDSIFIWLKLSTNILLMKKLKWFKFSRKTDNKTILVISGKKTKTIIRWTKFFFYFIMYKILVLSLSYLRI